MEHVIQDVQDALHVQVTVTLHVMIIVEVDVVVDAVDVVETVPLDVQIIVEMSVADVIHYAQVDVLQLALPAEDPVLNHVDQYVLMDAVEDVEVIVLDNALKHAVGDVLDVDRHVVQHVEEAVQVDVEEDALQDVQEVAKEDVRDVQEVAVVLDV